MSAYFELGRPENPQNIYAQYQNEFKAKGIENSTAHITVEMMFLQSFQDPDAAEEHLAKIIEMNEKYEKATHLKSLIGFYIKEH